MAFLRSVLFSFIAGAVADVSLAAPGEPNTAGKTHDVTAQYIARDLAAFLKPRSPFIGFIGDNYQRLQIVLTGLTRDTKNPAIYHVTGYTVVKKNRCDFAGEITVVKIALGPPFNYGEDGDAPRIETAGRKLQGFIEGRYQFRENPSQPHAGVFDGTMSVDVYLDMKGKLRYDDIDIDADGYANDRYIGTWSGAKGTRKTANWGEWRIPNSGDLDGGAGEFSPIDQYRKNGWDDYKPGG